MPSAPPEPYTAYDVNGDGKPDFFTFAGPDGRIDRIGYDDNGDGKPDRIIDLDKIDYSQSRHLVIILDGFGYDLVKGYMDSGHLRMFYPPSKVVAPYPSLTDLAIEDLFNYESCGGFEAMYYDRQKNRLVGGSGAYMRGENEPYNRLLQYRANLIWDAIGYLTPWAVFGKELNDAETGFKNSKLKEYRAYFVSSAGVGTTQGAEGQRKCLAEVERWILQVLWETQGKTKITLLADHGHSYTPATRIPLEKCLTDHKWRLTDSLRGPRDVVYIRFGLETYASFAANNPSDLSADLVTCEGVTLASYAQDNEVVLLAPGGQKAIIRQHADRYRYEAESGDPLKLKAILAKLPADAEGYYGADDLLHATIDHEWPAPLQRLYRAHFGLAKHTPDVIVSLANNYYSGASSFGSSVKIASTHGSLNLTNSRTFIMSTQAPLPPVMRSADVPKAMTKMTGAPWPLKE